MSCRPLLQIAVLFVLAFQSASVFSAEPLIRVVVWDEQQPAQKQAYENFLGNAIAEHLSKQPGLRVISANIDQPEKGLPASLLDNTDVLIWWGHARHNEITPEMAKAASSTSVPATKRIRSSNKNCR